jgi:hypothetical protein
MSESDDDKLARVRLMAKGDPTWDLSPNDLAALKYVLAQLAAAQACERKLRSKLSDVCEAGAHVARMWDGWDTNRFNGDDMTRAIEDELVPAVSDGRCANEDEASEPVQRVGPAASTSEGE